MAKVPHSITQSSISVLVDYRMRVVPASSINFVALRDELRKPEPNMRRVKELVDIPTFIAKVTIGRIRISDDEVYFRDVKVASYAGKRLLEHLAAGDPIEPLAKLLDKLMDNPDLTLREDLWKWIEQAELPICEDGDLVAFKKVMQDYTSFGVDQQKNRIFDWHVGKFPSMPREDCDSNRNADCSTGLHFCSWNYLPGFHGNTGHVVILKINPRDVTSIPRTDTQKGRCCLCEVIGEVPEEEARQFFSGNVVSAVGTYREPAHDNDDPTPSYPENDDDGPDYTTGEGEDEGSGEVVTGDLADDAESDGFTVVISGRRFNIQTVKDTVKSVGQRGAAKQLKVPRTSLQDALKRIS